ncbi:MAG: chitin deacetylase [Thermoplasmata archaeon]|jgi:hypothetical protein|nr:chitin deacetylase [Thermoplasmata archaeon]
MTCRLVFTVDVDRDVNIHIDGTDAAGSIDRGSGTGPRFSSSERGLGIILDILDELGIRATFFVEGRTAETFDCSVISGHCVGFHGYDHEDLTLVKDLSDVMDRGYLAVKDRISAPTCFRAPFMSEDDRVLAELERLGIRHDSSVYADPGTLPYCIGGITQHPVAKGRDADGRTIAAYLWPMHEGKRKPSDYIDLAASMDDGELVLSTHSWHMVERRDDGVMADDWVSGNARDVKHVIEGILDAGFVPSIITG